MKFFGESVTEGQSVSSNLPDEDNDKSVDTFGIGTYDDGFDRNNKSKGDVKKNSLPMDGGPFDPIGPDRLLSYQDKPIRKTNYF